MTRPTVFGPTYSVYTRIARLALEERARPTTSSTSRCCRVRTSGRTFCSSNPFGKLPAFAHDTLSLYETGAITRYVDRAFPGLALQPAEPNALARVDQVISIVDFFAYACMIGVWHGNAGRPDAEGSAGRARAIAACLPQARLCLSELSRLLGASPWFGGAAISLADLHLAPVMAYVSGTPEGVGLHRRTAGADILVGAHVRASEHGQHPAAIRLRTHP